MTRTWLYRTVLAALLLSAIPLDAQAPAAAGKKNPYLKLVEPWPDADRLRERQQAAQNRALFKSTEPLAITITSDFKKVNKDRTVDSPRRYEATLAVDGTPVSMPIKLGTRGHFRLHPSSCGFVPLRVDFDAKGVAGTVFDGHRSLKLVTHCHNEDSYEQYTLHEYSVYRMFNLMTPRSFRARLVKATYVDEGEKKTVARRYAMFLEDDDDVARRVEGRIIDIPNLLFKDVDQAALTQMTLFNYMIANTDYSIIKLHNVRLIQDRNKTNYTVPYDFDFSGLVNTRYSNPDPKLGIQSVRERLYRGPCQTIDVLEPMLQRFRDKKEEMLKVYESVPDLNASGRRDAPKFLQEFFSIIERQDRAKRVLVDGCRKAPGM